MISMAKSGAFLDYTPPAASQLTLPDSLKATAGKTYPDTSVQMGIAYNTSSISDSAMSSITSWKDLDSPKLAKLKIGFVSPAAGGTALTAFYYLENVLGAAFTSKFLATHDIVTFNSAQPAAEAVASGQIDVAIPMAANAALALWSQGAPLHFRTLSPEIDVSNMIGIPVKAKHPAAAKLYENFLLSPTAQRIYNTEAYQKPVNSTVADGRKSTSQSWWVTPTDFYAFDPITVNAQASKLTDLYNSLNKGS
jgi:ABC-type Fe3+ transport system substrate-binding protein